MQHMTLVPHGPWDDIPAEEVMGCDWEDVIDKEGEEDPHGTRQRDEEMVRGGSSHLVWSSAWRSRGRGWLGSGASGKRQERFQ